MIKRLCKWILREEIAIHRETESLAFRLAEDLKARGVISDDITAGLAIRWQGETCDIFIAHGLLTNDVMKILSTFEGVHAGLEEEGEKRLFDCVTADLGKMIAGDEAAKERHCTEFDAAVAKIEAMDEDKDREVKKAARNLMRGGVVWVDEEKDILGDQRDFLGLPPESYPPTWGPRPVRAESSAGRKFLAPDGEDAPWTFVGVDPGEEDAPRYQYCGIDLTGGEQRRASGPPFAESPLWTDLNDLKNPFRHWFWDGPPYAVPPFWGENERDFLGSPPGSGRKFLDPGEEGAQFQRGVIEGHRNPMTWYRAEGPCVKIKTPSWAPLNCATEDEEDEK